MAFKSGGSLIGLSLVLTDLVAFDSAITILQLNLATSLLRSDKEFIEGCVTWDNINLDWPMIRYIITVIGVKICCFWEQVFCGDDKVDYRLA
ncbi:hypothetical protein BpHYR1_024972 [Brachionus plicatilis]|uniref:Uncharacterized protein n=1 Tax=Brachionus plicatilis TaxID=10195 RepID=A0A3M7SA00_BRAPC|nr:hypothetical protein BpHYR1_024972 [Brachionus plicatilis]